MASAPPTAIRNVDVLSMKDDQIARDRTVLVEGGLIAAIGPSDQVEIPPGAAIIEGRGKTLIPGLFDMHTHIVPHVVMPVDGDDPIDVSINMAGEYLGLFLAHGVTVIRNQAGTDFLLKVREAADAGRFAAPKVTLSGPTCEQVFLTPRSTYRAQVKSPEDAVREINRQVDAGFDCIKIYNNTSKEVFEALMRTARDRGVKIGGHVPTPVGLFGCLKAGLDAIEHLQGMESLLDTRPFHLRKPTFPADRYPGWGVTNSAKIAELADRIAEYRDTWQSPTMVVEDFEHSEIVYPKAVMDGVPWSVQQHLEGLRGEAMPTDDERVALRRVRDNRREMLRELDRRDVNMFTASDCPGASRRLIPGYSLLEEIEAFVAAGISPYRALRAATIQPARYLGLQDSRGTLEIGKRADMVLLDDDPLADISAVHRRAGVMMGGTWYPTGEVFSDAVMAWRNQPGVSVARAETSKGEIQWGMAPGAPLTRAGKVVTRLQ